MALSGLGLAYSVAGGVLLWSGIRGESVAQTVQDLAHGRQPSGANQEPVNTAAAPAAASAVAGGDPGGSSISSDAAQYAGHAYLYGGAPGPNGTAPWDCSSFANWVLGHDLGMTLPGASSPGYNGASHGPDTLLYLAWSRATTVGHTAAAAEAGDLCVWQTHMGFALGGGQMISALDEALGTRVTTIPGGAPGGEVLFVRRVIVAGVVQAPGSSTAAGRG